MSHVGFCDICQKPASQRCGGCHEIFYCTKEHQKYGWKNHKKSCRPCKIAEDEFLGRYLLSTKSIKSGETIFKERPLIYGPCQVTVPVCLGCFKVIDENNNRPCSECGWPMCSDICQKNPSHLPECRYTVQRGDKVSIRNFGMVHPIYQCVTVLRCLYQKQFLPEIWTKLNKLESHDEERKNTAKYKNERVQVAEFIRRFFKLDQVFSEDDIMHVCGIIMVNSHEVPLSDPPYIAIYETCSMFEHRPPLGHTQQEAPSVRDEIFWCTCTRCSDPTEYGTYFSAMKCQERKCDGYSLPTTFLEKTDNTKNSDWKCNKCKKNISCFSIQDVLERLGSDLSEIVKDDPKSLKHFINSSSSYLHPNHYYLTEVRIALVQLIGQDSRADVFTGVSDEDLNSKAANAGQLLNLLGVIAPAERRLRGVLLFELHAAVAEMGRRSGTTFGETDVMHMRLIEAKQYLIDSIEFLKNEPSFLPEGQILKQAKHNLKNIDIVLQKIHESINNPH
ncbi:hypothetical protein HHI36_014177 [Cryptolaemus montrouzieri]|uniref:MYND-type domain-containing protein n=1 Tax=Cryptolaemus montrouzieri TaxID=559131 RepID=A0ABD2N1S3_9CUCU